MNIFVLIVNEISCLCVQCTTRQHFFCTWTLFQNTTVYEASLFVGLGYTIAYRYFYHSSSISNMPHFSQVRLYVVDRNTGKVVETKYMSTDTFFCFHHVNMYEDKGK